MDGYTPNHRLLQQVEQSEREAQLRLSAARDQAKKQKGGPPPEHHELIRRLEEEWKRARERLHRARHAARD